MNTVGRLALFVAVCLLPGTLHAAPPHTGQVIHDGFELSDVALFACAAAGVWLARRSMRARARSKAARED